MHMADALISPAVGGTMWVASAGIAGWCCKQLKTDLGEKKIPLMGVAAAFTFAAQMINFTIPGTGSSGHLGGGVLLSILLGPHAALLTMVSILTVQALFFADGGLLALGCNIFNLGVLPCFVAYPLIYRRLVTKNSSRRRIGIASVLTAVIALQLGAFFVVLETTASGISSLPIGTFSLLMLPIHLAIGLVEGAATAAVVGFVSESRPELLFSSATTKRKGRFTKHVLPTLAGAALVIGGGVSWFASTLPDGLEWAVEKTAGDAAQTDAVSDEPHRTARALQEQIALMPDYDFKSAARTEAPAQAKESWPSVNAGTSAAGIAGGLITLLLTVAIAWIFGRKRRASVE
jgi:cobalt/nickel transport system permease protein